MKKSHSLTRLAECLNFRQDRGSVAQLDRASPCGGGGRRFESCRDHFESTVMKLTLSTPVEQLSRVGSVTAKKIRKLGIETVRDLIFYFPFRHEDLRTVTTIASLVPNTRATLEATIEQIKNRRSPVQKRRLTEAVISDVTGSLRVVWFNQPYLEKTLSPGTTCYFSGKVSPDRYDIQMVNPLYEKSGSALPTHTARIVPMYCLTSGITQKQLRFLIKLSLGAVDQVEDWLPQTTLGAEKLLPLSQAIQEIHFPSSFEKLDQALERLKFNELLLFQMKVQQVKRERRLEQAPALRFFEKETKAMVESLPFQLTPDQRAAAWQIITDLGRPHPMHRLLEGEVGSGKTIVAALAMLNVGLNQAQAVLMAPTDILAHQHFNTLCQLPALSAFEIGLMTRTSQQTNRGEFSKAELRKKITAGQVSILIGTHAVIQQGVSFHKLALAVIDEQHRFGVAQRHALVAQSGNTKSVPHLLSMTATPIPRSLSLALYGDLDLSIIKTLPAERRPILTKLVTPDNRLKAYAFIRQQIQAGRQAFVVCPLIDPSDKLGVRSVTDEFKKLQTEIFPDLKLAILHGKLKPAEKEGTMRSFAAGETQILVATSVIEVGINIPNATIMMIEGAQRFGLAQLHQFRGRVGRSEHQAYCLLFTELFNGKTKQRLEAVIASRDGLSLAEKDLELRGPGQMYGSSQSGWPDFQLATIYDYDLIKRAGFTASVLHPELNKYPLLAAQVAEATEAVHLE